MRTCVHHGEEYLLGHGRYRCTSPEITIRTSCDQPPDVEHPPCFVPLPVPEPDPVPSSRPVTFAAILAYHRQRADDWRSADRPWHAEAVLVLRKLVGYFGEICRPCTGEYDGEVCQYDRCLIWRARKAVEVET